MASLPRQAILEDDSTFHVTWQCHNQEWLLKDRWAKELYYALLFKYKDRYKVDIYSYCFMDNHPHLTGRCASLELFSDFFRVVNSCFARACNRRMKRRGQVVMDRFKSPRIQTDAHLLTVMLYVDLNPKRSGKNRHPQNNEFSSYSYYAEGNPDPLITPAPSYLDMAATPEKRQAAYRSLVEEILKNDWKEKKPYSSLPFIGNPDWVIRKTRALKIVSRERYLRWQKRYQLKFG